MNVTSTVRDHIATYGGNVTRMMAWLSAHSTLGNARMVSTHNSLLAANFEVQCYCCGSWVNGTMIALDHVNNDGKNDLDASGKRLAGSKLAEAWYRDHKNGNAYHMVLASCCSNCNASKNANNGECMCSNAQTRRNA